MNGISRHDERRVFVISAEGEIHAELFTKLVWESEETTTTPNGVEAKIHVRGRELWTWGHCGSAPRRIVECESEEEALQLKFNCALYDFEHDNEAPATFNYISEAMLVWESEETTTTPNGVEAKIHARGRELRTRGHCGSAPRRIVECESEEEALQLKFNCALYDFEHDNEAPATFNSISEAMNELGERKIREQ